METGLYTITAPNGNFYLGSTTRSFKRRWQEHRTELKHRKHNNPVLQAAWDKYGVDGLVFAVYMRCSPEECEAHELEAITKLGPHYNLALDTLAPFKGRKHTDLAKEKCRRVHLGKKRAPFSPEHRARLSEALRLRVLKPRSEEYRAKQRAAQAGKTLSDAHKAAISAAGIGQKRPPSEAHRKAISLAKIGTKTGAENPVARPVLCVETGAIFPTVKAAADWIGIERNKPTLHSNISSCCACRLKRAYGYTWRYAD